MDTSNPNNYLGPGEKEQVEADFQRFVSSLGDNPHDWSPNLTDAEEIFKWAAVLYRSGMRPNGYPEWVKIEEAA